MNDVREEAQRQLEEVRRDFASRVGDMVEEIVCAWKTAQAASDPVSSLGSMTELVHQLAGNAGFFGLVDISRSASELEQRLDRLGIQTLSEAEVGETHRLVQILRIHARS